MDWLIGLDVGTSAAKGILVSAAGEQRARARRLTRFLRPQPGCVEVDPEEHYRSVCDLLRELGSRLPAGERVRALCMSFASGNTLLLDRDERPLTNIINWLDSRARGEEDRLYPGLNAEEVHRVVGWPGVRFGFPMAHLAWLKAHRPEVYRQAARVCMSNDYLTFRLTGRWGIDPSTATTFYLQNQVQRRWHRPFLEMLEIPEEALSPLSPSGTPLGPLSAAGAADTGLSRETLVVLGSFDHPAAARGTGFTRVGDLLLSCGTSWVGFFPVADRDLALSQQLLVDPFLSPGGPWACMAALTGIGALIDWYIEHLVLRGGEAEDPYALFNAAAAASPPGARGLLLDPYPEGSRMDAKAAEAHRDRSREDLARAVMEAPALRMRARLEPLRRAGIGAERIAMVGGPAESPLWPRIVAEITGLELVLTDGQTAGALGAAILAAVGAGIYRDEGQGFAAMGGRRTVIRPQHEAVRAYQGVYARYRESFEHD